MATLGGQIGQIPGQSVGAVSVSSNSTDDVQTLTVAVAAGIGSFTANKSAAVIDPAVSSAVSDNTSIVSDGAMGVTSQEVPYTSAQALGVDVAGVGVGVVDSTANVAGSTSSGLGSTVTIVAPALVVEADRSPDSNNDPTAQLRRPPASAECWRASTPQSARPRAAAA